MTFVGHFGCTRNGNTRFYVHAQHGYLFVTTLDRLARPSDVSNLPDCMISVHDLIAAV